MPSITWGELFEKKPEKGNEFHLQCCEINLMGSVSLGPPLACPACNALSHIYFLQRRIYSALSELCMCLSLYQHTIPVLTDLCLYYWWANRCLTPKLSSWKWVQSRLFLAIITKLLRFLICLVDLSLTLFFYEIGEGENERSWQFWDDNKRDPWIVDGIFTHARDMWGAPWFQLSQYYFSTLRGWERDVEESCFFFLCVQTQIS